jgi:hypothetical protein
MERIYTRLLADAELVAQLEAYGPTIQWHEAERQVERLGFGDLYIVSSTQGPLGIDSKISLKPDLAAGAIAQLSRGSAPVTGVGLSHQPSV